MGSNPTWGTMKVKDLSGREHSWPPQGHEVGFNDKRPRSSLHVRCRELLRQMYPTQPILEEVPILGENLTCDFYLPFRQVVVECHGEQHYKFIPHFHGTRLGFSHSRYNDREKKEWCALNNIRMAILPFSETDDEWRNRIEEAQAKD